MAHNFKQVFSFFVFYSLKIDLDGLAKDGCRLRLLFSYFTFEQRPKSGKDFHYHSSESLHHVFF